MFQTLHGFKISSPSPENEKIFGSVQTALAGQDKGQNECENAGQNKSRNEDRNVRNNEQKRTGNLRREAQSAPWTNGCFIRHCQAGRSLNDFSRMQQQQQKA